MMLKLIGDVNKALDSDCYFAALSLALTFPDICGKAEYPNVNNTKRYIDWYDEHIGKYEQCPCELFGKAPMPYLSGKVVYNLRNSFLHQGTPTITVDKTKNDLNKIDLFELVLESKNSVDIYCDAAGIYNESLRTYRVNIRRLCLILCCSVSAYYEANPEKFDFFHCSIIDRPSDFNKKTF